LAVPLIVVAHVARLPGCRRLGRNALYRPELFECFGPGPYDYLPGPLDPWCDPDEPEPEAETIDFAELMEQAA